MWNITTYNSQPMFIYECLSEHGDTKKKKSKKVQKEKEVYLYTN